LNEEPDMDDAGSRRSVLVVDDAPAIRMRIGRFVAETAGLVLAGYAEDADGAIAQIERNPPDAVLLDVSLGEQRGLDVLLHVARHHPEVRVAVLSNFGWPAIREGFLLAGAEAYFDKAHEFADALDWLSALASGTPATDALFSNAEAKAVG